MMVLQTVIPRLALVLGVTSMATASWAAGGGMPIVLRSSAAASAGIRAPVPAALNPIAVGPNRTEADMAAIIATHGRIVSRAPVGGGGLTAWTVEKEGRQVVLYSTNDGQVIIAGALWDAASGRNLSDQFITPSVEMGNAVYGNNRIPTNLGVQAPPAAQSPMMGTFKGTLPESITTVDSLAGIREGKGSAADTLYIIFDPICHYCRDAYHGTRAYVERGVTIKWIPAAALAQPAQSVPLAAAVLQAAPGDRAELLRRVLGNKEQIPVQPTKDTEVSLAKNLSFFRAVFDRNQQQAGVPVGFFLNKQTGQAQMMTGISNPTVIEAVLGKP